VAGPRGYNVAPVMPMARCVVELGSARAAAHGCARRTTVHVETMHELAKTDADSPVGLTRPFVVAADVQLAD